MSQPRSDLARARIAAGLTQESLAEILRVHPDTVRRWERGSTQPTPPVRPHLAQALGLSRADLEHRLGSNARTIEGHLTAPHVGPVTPSDDEPMQPFGRRQFLGLAGAAVTSGALGLHSTDDVTSELLLRSWFAGLPSDRPARPVHELAAAVAAMKLEYQACRYQTAGRHLPLLLDELERSTST